MKNPTIILCVLTLMVLAVVVSGCGVRSENTINSRPLLSTEDTHQLLLERISELRGELLAPDGRSLPFVIGTTSRGNGTLEIVNLTVRIIDRHDDGAIYFPPLMNITVIEDEKKVCRALTISGWIITTDEKRYEEIAREFISIHFVYDEKTQRFVTAASNSVSRVVMNQDRK